MTTDDWNKLKTGNRLKLQKGTAEITVELVDRDHMGRWIALEIAANQPVSSLTIERQPQFWKHIS